MMISLSTGQAGALVLIGFIVAWWGIRLMHWIEKAKRTNRERQRASRENEIYQISLRTALAVRDRFVKDKVEGPEGLMEQAAQEGCRRAMAWHNHVENHSKEVKKEDDAVRPRSVALDYALVRCADDVDEDIKGAFHSAIRVQKAALEELKAGRLKLPVDEETALRFILDYLRALSPEKEASE